jgi:hypothetical protein
MENGSTDLNLQLLNISTKRLRVDLGKIGLKTWSKEMIVLFISVFTKMVTELYMKLKHWKWKICFWVINQMNWTNLSFYTVHKRHTNPLSCSQLPPKKNVPFHATWLKLYNTLFKNILLISTNLQQITQNINMLTMKRFFSHILLQRKNDTIRKKKAPLHTKLVRSHVGERFFG